MNNTVTIEYPSPQIAILCIRDEKNKNSFTIELMHALYEAFQKIRANSSLKVLILAGYDGFFLNGANTKNLTDMVQGELPLNPKHASVFSLALECDIPTIAAMEGHAFGGGLCFGLFADIIIMGEDSKYASTFMQYGYTPGDGATFIIPEKLGEILGSEMLLTARFYKGSELHNRCAGVQVVKNTLVLKTALKMAKELSVLPRSSLLLLKEHMTLAARNALPKIYELESQMQKKTLKLPEVLELIKSLGV